MLFFFLKQSHAYPYRQLNLGHRPYRSFIKVGENKTLIRFWVTADAAFTYNADTMVCAAYRVNEIANFFSFCVRTNQGGLNTTRPKQGWTGLFKTWTSAPAGEWINLGSPLVCQPVDPQTYP